ncbi:sensor histidine kinase [Parvularcula maris]|uniref:histidine kinase n=1 Tax=Parvularcula maris TaxID=2965077 RepID=A0A9X2L726_9PROT|nr:HAMP domain-containing histidine kinase [Parvularcula maris]
MSGAKLFSTTPGRLRGARLTELVTARHHPKVLHALAEVQASGRAALSVDLNRAAKVPHARIELRSPRRGVVEARLRPLLTSRSEPAPSKQAPADKEQLADVSHEIRTPLNAVIGFADALRQESFGPLGDKRYRDYARLIQESGQHVLALVNDLLDLSKAEADKLECRVEPVHAGDLVAACASMLALQAKEAGLTLRVETAPQVGILTIDPKIVRQILLNLLSNALKFTEEGSVTVRTRLMGGNLVITVEDTGVGMEEDQVERLGERYYQARGEGVRGAKGTGLGLALSSALAKAHGGRLDILSQPGRGTTASLTIPAVAKKKPRRYEPIPYQDQRSA